MIKTLLFDLDDTLLGNEVEQFMKQYFGLLSAYAGQLFDESVFMPSLLQSTQAMMRDVNPALTNDRVFWASFEQLTGGKRDELEAFFMRFYETDFLRLRDATTLRPAAATLVRGALDAGLAVVVATNPLFPRVAIECRLEWAGLPLSEYDFALVTSYENMHATKPNPAYYREILATLDEEPQHALMVGDDWKNDIVPAAEVGLHTYWVAPDGRTPPDPRLVSAHGTLDALAERVAGGWLDELAVAAASR